MILAVRDKFHHWAQGPAAAATTAAATATAAVTGSLHLPDARCLKPALGIISHTRLR